MNLAKSPEEQHENDLTQMRGAQMLLDLETGRRQATAVAQKTVEKLRSIYAVYEDYADAVFGAARAHHVNAYAGATEIIFAVRNTVQSAPLNLYEHLKTLHVEQVDRFLAERGFRTYAIPPFASIVLSRCKRREDIVPELLRARDEFSAFRETCTHHARRVRDACLGGTHEDVIRMSNDLDRAMEVLSRKVKQSEKDRRWVYRVWDVVKELEPLGMAKSLIDKLIANDIEREHLRSLNGLMDVWKKLSKASSYERVLRSGLFPNEYMPEEFAAFSEWAESVPQVVGLRRSSDPPSPSAGTESTAKTTAKRRRTPNSSVSGRAAPRRRRKK
jgi:hypothetical protein